MFCETEEEVTRAGNIAKSVIESLGLEVAMNKTKVVDFKNDDFDFLGFHFNHWKTSKKGNDYYSIVPTEKSVKTFKKAIKDKTQRIWTKPKEEWIKDINPIIVGKTNYYLNVYKVLKVFEYHMHRNKVDMEKRIQKFKELGIAFYTKKRLKKMDDSLSR